MAQTSRSSPAIGGAVPTQCTFLKVFLHAVGRPDAYETYRRNEKKRLSMNRPRGTSLAFWIESVGSERVP